MLKIRPVMVDFESLVDTCYCGQSVQRRKWAAHQKDCAAAQEAKVRIAAEIEAAEAADKIDVW